MKLDEEKIGLLQVVLTGTEDKEENVEFADENGFKTETYFAVTPSHCWKYWPEDNAKEISIESFLKALEGKELKARYFLGWEGGKQNYRYYDEWSKLADAMGVSQMVALTTKVPKNVARRFSIFANEENSVSETLRKLIYNYVKGYMADHSDKLMFREQV